MESDNPNARRYPAKPADAYLFATCLIDQFAPEAGLDAVRLLEREGIAIHFSAAQTCCGQPAYTSGYPDEARAVVGFARPDGGAPCTIALHTSCHARRDMSVHETGAALLAGLGQVTVAQ